MTAATLSPSRDVRTIGLVSAGHLMSHFYMMALPPLFPLLRSEMGVSNTELGAIITVAAIAAGVGQMPTGIAVDRFGARWVLIGGVAVMAMTVALMGLAPGYAWLPVLAVFLGLANAVFHPADYAILSHAVRSERVGRAYSLHTFSGYLGWTAAPMLMTLLAALWGWRVALLGAAAVGAVVVLALYLGRSHLSSAGAAKPRDAAPKPVGAAASATSLSVLVHPGILVMFGYFVMNAMTTVGLNSFTVTALHDLHGLDFVAANAGLTAFLVGACFGVLAGGVIADRTRRYELVAAAGFIASSSAVLSIAFVPLGTLGSAAALGVAGFMLGSILPSRDMIVRSLTPTGASGRVFGFLSVGIEIGAAVSPTLFGFIIDQGRPELVFVLCAGFMMTAMLGATTAAVLARRKPHA